MTLTKKSVETLIDLVEIKLSCIEVFDGQDGQTVNRLEQCRRELYTLIGQEPPQDERLAMGRSAVA